MPRSRRKQRHYLNGIRARYPALGKLLHLTKIDRWFIPALVLVLLAPLIGVFALLKLWRTSPPGFVPPVHISALDYFQVKAFIRRAQSAEANGNTADAKRAWSHAAANNPGNPELLRNTLRVMSTMPPSDHTAQEIGLYGSWLLRLTEGKPTTDIPLVLSAYEHARLFPEIISLLQSDTIVENEETTPFLVRAWFGLGQYQPVREFFDQNPEIRNHDSMMALYDLAAHALTIRDDASIQEFETKYTNENRSSLERLLADRVALRVYTAARRTTEATRIIEYLVSKNADTLPDHLVYWHMWIQSGKSNLVSELHHSAGAPVTVVEALALARTFREAGLPEKAAEVAKEALVRFKESSIVLWLEYGNQLIQNEDWHALNALAQSASNASAPSGDLKPIAHYWEGLSALSAGRPEVSKEHFQKMATAPPEAPKLRVEMAMKLLTLDQTQTADHLVAGLAGQTPDVQTYWLNRTTQAFETKDATKFTAVAKTAYESDPTFLPHVNNYLSALLGQRTSPELALQLSQELIDSAPTFIAFQLNRAHALCLNEMWDEAQSVLEAIPAEEREVPLIANDYQLVQFRLAVGRDDREAAIRIFQVLDTSGLMDATAEWVEGVSRQLGSQALDSQKQF